MTDLGVRLVEAKDLEITLVVDNYADLLLRSKPGVQRYGAGKEPLLAEHGLSIHLRLGTEGREILLDVGYSKVAVPHNLSRLGIDPAAVDQVVISHGHRDHTGALLEFLGLAGKQVPVVVHRDAFLERWFVYSDGSKVGPWQESRQVWQEAGAEVVCVTGSYQLASGCLATGPVPRRTDFEETSTTAFCVKDGRMVRDLIHDDQAIVVNVQGKGLVVIAGCAHSGIINTIIYAQEISGVDEVFAVVGGFHLSGTTPEKVERTIKELKGFGPSIVMPAHCTGLEATSQFAVEMPGEFLQSAVGTTLKI